MPKYKKDVALYICPKMKRVVETPYLFCAKVLRSKERKSQLVHSPELKAAFTHRTIFNAMYATDKLKLQTVYQK